MILRIVRGTLTNLPRLEAPASLAAARLRLVEAGASSRETYVGWRETTEGVMVAVVTAWQDAGTAAAFQADLLVFEEAAHPVEPVLYECDTGGTFGMVGRAGVLRIAAGWIERGPDAEIQQELRRRLPGLGPELLDAYVGRRIRAGSVEILLVATWTKEPVDQPLDEPLWPDITARYREFIAETYAPVLPD